jgi:hypothetical protein
MDPLFQVTKVNPLKYKLDLIFKEKMLLNGLSLFARSLVFLGTLLSFTIPQNATATPVKQNGNSSTQISTKLENQCRTRAKEWALQTYQTCMTEARTEQIEQIRREYQQKLKSLKSDYENQIQALKSALQIELNKETSQVPPVSTKVEFEKTNLDKTENEPSPSIASGSSETKLETHEAQDNSLINEGEREKAPAAALDTEKGVESTAKLSEGQQAQIESKPEDNSKGEDLKDDDRSPEEKKGQDNQSEAQIVLKPATTSKIRRTEAKPQNDKMRTSAGKKIVSNSKKGPAGKSTLPSSIASTTGSEAASLIFTLPTKKVTSVTKPASEIVTGQQKTKTAIIKSSELEEETLAPNTRQK